MREYKYRVWVDGKIIGYELFEDGNWYYYSVCNNGLTMGEVLPGVFAYFGEREQFTGLLDKNGREIYEGDILANGYGRCGEVLWNDQIALFQCSISCVAFETINWEICEIVGNVTDNPELLK